MEKTGTTKASVKNTPQRKTLAGVVVSDKMTDKIVIEVTRFVKHPKYGKFMKQSKNFKAHDAGNTAHIGDTVEIIETRPISKDTHFKLSKIITKKISEEIAA